MVKQLSNDRQTVVLTFFLSPLSPNALGVTASRFAQLATRWLSGREPGSGLLSPSSPSASVGDPVSLSLIYDSFLGA